MGPHILALATGFFLGVRHCLEPDHLTALAQMASASPSPRQGLRSGLLWGVGHAVSVVVLGVVLAAFWSRLPQVDVRAEQAVGVTLILLSLWRLRVFLTQEHEHVHRHAGGVTHSHPHRHGTGHVHWHTPTLTGLVHGAAGALGTVALLSFATSAPPLLMTLAFSLGALLAMGAAGWLAARFYARMSQLRVGRIVHGVTCAWGFALGVFWLVG